ncbi:MAG: hypothetical protein ABF258_10840, partial [Flavobacteriales bacterium]
PSTLRIGVGIQFGKRLEIGAEMIAPLNDNPGNFDAALFSAGADLKLGPIIFQAGIVGQNDEILRIPVGFVLSPRKGRYEMGISTRDILSLIDINGVDRPMISAAFGFLRFRI